MYVPGDIVVGYPDYYESDGKRYIREEFGKEPGQVECSEYKSVLITCSNHPEARYMRIFTNQSADEKYLQEMDYKDISGIVVEVDELDAERPHWDGIVKVLVEDQMLWFWARNLRIAKYATDTL